MKSRGLVRAAVWGTAAVLAVRVANAQDTTGTVPTTDPAPTDVVIVTEPTEPTEPVPLTGPESVPQNRIANDFRPMLGNDAEAVVSGLRSGDAITLTETTPGTLPGDPPVVTTVTIDSPTGPMGIGEVDHTLDLAKFQLAQSGITDPTASELQAVLTGGSITLADGTTTTYQGILAMRADGMGWGQIAQDLGTTMGAIKSGRAMETLPSTPVEGGTEVTTGGETAPSDDAATTTTTSHGREHGIVNATGESVASLPSGAHGGGKGRDAGITDALGAGSAGHGRSDSQVTNALGESSSLHGPGRGQGIVDGLGAGSDGGAKHVVNAMGSSNGGGHGVGAGIVDGLGASTDGGRGAAAVTDALGNSGGGGGFGGGHGGGNGGGNGGGHGRGGH